MSKNWLLKLMSVMVLFTLVLSACASAAPVEEQGQVAAPVVTKAPAAAVEPAGETPQEAAPPPADEQLSGKLVLWGWSFDVFETPGLIDDFKQAYPGIEVEIIKYSAGDTYQNLQLAISAGQGAPDIIQIENSNLAQFVELGGLADISDKVAPYLEKVNQYKWVDARKDGEYYAMPWDSGPVVMYYRRDVFKAAGLSDDPAEVDKMVATWDSYLEVCKTILDKTGHKCFAHSTANNDARLYEIALWQQGLGYYDAAGRLTVDSPENIATLEKLAQFWTAGVTTEEVPWTDPWYAELSNIEDPVATIVEASWLGVFLKSWIASDTSGLWGVARMPAFVEGQPRAANDGGSTLAISEQSQNKEAAWAFIEFMLAQEPNVLKSFAYSDFMPALETVYTDPIFDEADPFYGGQKTRQVYLETAKIVPDALIYGRYYQLMHGHLQTAIQKFSTEKASAADALKEAAAAIRLETGMP
jgi:ABC-type glycerol-3-phosphate transport system substrate-binding protein